ncbi:SDR family NAD(P)-dependent oxidoreductase [Acidocella aminolytica]|jgi:3-hydroxy acid dehydrogenase/malonic semialdehyde reductase|uniref:Oxidoreductase/short-chain dehydrogenase/reductase SDR n=1 Tax=Acidocella aminolytica 101 = DSM 11237 TaxID=1120923 RepID=A0A0D6PCN6_9PROT|nr:SDR family NAD(P)-dependent oxidoreductase [Acidocella aminolytica]GAN79101.1 oxidoreductase/short-chain dehydrogenase/reductase SDR [Acidocella aminolytica 101 = DSM 11237]GBQ43817.1 oxidoreductase [Acidocella aminolytica 101 = DSM 11237]SHE64579.1 3-hydroxy acid dehydrogenase / malonic semialdehyde reductase [Acidocella aminolytica 101 = DSM 11237]
MKTILVTGATAGFGAAFARRFIKDGHRVIATGRRVERLDALRQELGDNLLTARLDVTDKAAIEGFLPSLSDSWHKIDVLVNNAGLALGLSPAWEADLEDWDTMVATNITGLIHMTRAVLPQMVERDDGQILNLGSVAGEYPYPGGHVYGATKAFVRQFSLNLRADLVGKNVRVTDIEPGMVDGSEFSQVRFGGDESRARAVYQGTKSLNPDDIAETASWLISLPPHMNINRVEMMPTCQASGAFAVKRS